MLQLEVHSESADLRQGRFHLSELRLPILDIDWFVLSCIHHKPYFFPAPAARTFSPLPISHQSLTPSCTKSNRHSKVCESGSKSVTTHL